jgi:Tol biopolymer transport system component
VWTRWPSDRRPTSPFSPASSRSSRSLVYNSPTQSAAGAKKQVSRTPAQRSALLASASRIPPSARKSFIREAAGDDEELFAELMLLLDGSDTEIYERAARLLAESAPLAGEPAPSPLPPLPRTQRQLLASGTQVGIYRILAPLGIGGMGEVYRARDTTLQRDVAIKVLRADLASRPDLVERLKREAKLLAALNHRNVAAIYGLHEADGVIALVLELVEGPTLADRLADGPLPLGELLPIAKQIAEALEAAHDKGIVHRDLKPDNVKVKPDGEVKVLDFGIAKALNVSDTEDVDDGFETLPGAVFGTPAYMSPEQVRGLMVDRRADLWAFGLLLWEMLTGRPAFGGATAQDRINAVLTTEPDWATLPRDTPEPFRRLLQRALQKDRRVRLDSAAVARLELDDALTAPALPSPAPRWALVPWAIAFVCVAALAAVVATAVLRRPVTPVATRVRVELGADIALREDLGPATVLSPDGRKVVFATSETDVPSMLYLRELDSLEATPLSSTENATSPFFSPDGQWIAFFADGKLKRISASGGAATVVCDAPNGRGGWWGTDDTIVFAGQRAARTTISRVSVPSGSPQAVTTLIDGEISHRWPQMLPGNRAVLYTSNTSDNWDDARIVVQPLPSGTPVVVQSGFFGRYVSSGHLLYVRRGALYAAPFDLARLQVTGPSAAVADDVHADPSTGSAQVSMSDAGSLVYLQGHGLSPGAPTVWMDRGGNTTPLRTKRSEWGNPRFSPDGRHLAFDVSDGKQVDVWVQDLATDQLVRLTFDPADDFKPVWSPDSEWVVFASKRDGVANLYRVRSDGVGNPERLTRSPNAQGPSSWHPSGRFLAFEEARPGTGIDVMTLAMPPRGAPEGKQGIPSVFASSPAVDAEPIFSPDGRWIAYRSHESGQIEVFVQAFDGVSGKWQVSNGGGRDAAWSTTRPELLYLGTTQDRVMVVPYTVAGNSFRAGTPRPWSIIRVGRPPRSGRTFDLHPDGERVVVAPAENQKSDHMTLVSDFVSRLLEPARASR